jgi:hypothetical protein
MPVADCSIASMLKNRMTQVMRDPVGVVSNVNVRYPLCFLPRLWRRTKQAKSAAENTAAAL